MFTKILKLIHNANLPKSQRDRIFEIIAHSNERSIEAQVGRAAKNAIMGWWYSMCNVLYKERKGG